VSFGSMNLRV